jgi:hypothetical protein
MRSNLPKGSFDARYLFNMIAVITQLSGIQVLG